MSFLLSLLYLTDSNSWSTLENRELMDLVKMTSKSKDSTGRPLCLRMWSNGTSTWKTRASTPLRRLFWLKASITLYWLLTELSRETTTQCQTLSKFYIKSFNLRKCNLNVSTRRWLSRMPNALLTKLADLNKRPQLNSWMRLKFKNSLNY